MRLGHSEWFSLMEKGTAAQKSLTLSTTSPGSLTYFLAACPSTTDPKRTTCNFRDPYTKR